MPHTLEIALVLLATVIGLEVAARRVALPSPFLLLPAGILLGYVPRFPHLAVDPNLVMFVFLPLLVYAGSALGSWVDFRKNLWPITLLSVGCVLFTTLIVAAAVHRLVPGFCWPAAFVLGAIVSPPDEVAAISIARRLGIPKDMSTILEGCRRLRRPPRRRPGCPGRPGPRRRTRRRPRRRAPPTAVRPPPPPSTARTTAGCACAAAGGPA